eukprot:CAMPEP_0113933636 /NCGR_PEP_ID=MMETSP1339-20121228/846_1 /TAXON_ID=94617 /ORGANISM="Fibrocapsa japonica" /LENGTH=345 /DNA_ID=CAMNT_0000935017 /DNA_START=384 /DNA_END=1421 /DNA_ORIENTATION=- /assembly_acc=CAM_ASM_000762
MDNISSLTKIVNLKRNNATKLKKTTKSSDDTTKLNKTTKSSQSALPDDKIKKNIYNYTTEVKGQQSNMLWRPTGKVQDIKNKLSEGKDANVGDAHIAPSTSVDGALSEGKGDDLFAPSTSVDGALSEGKDDDLLALAKRKPDVEAHDSSIASRLQRRHAKPPSRYLDSVDMVESKQKEKRKLKKQRKKEKDRAAKKLFDDGCLAENPVALGEVVASAPSSSVTKGVRAEAPPSTPHSLKVATLPPRTPVDSYIYDVENFDEDFSIYELTRYIELSSPNGKCFIKDVGNVFMSMEPKLRLARLEAAVLELEVDMVNRTSRYKSHPQRIEKLREYLKGGIMRMKQGS